MKTIVKTPSAYDFPLLLKYILTTPLVHAPEQEIVYRDQFRYTYRDFYRRLKNIASSMKAIGVEPGSVVAVMDYDSHRYLECFFVVPMMGCTLHTVNIRLSPEQILFTINHANDDVIIIHQDFLPLLEQMQPQITNHPKLIIIQESTPLESAINFAGDYESFAGTDAEFEFPDFDENTRATMFYTTGTTGDPKGVYYSHRQLVLHTLSGSVALAGIQSQGRFQSEDVYMPITPMFHVHAWGMPYIATMLGTKQVYCGRYEPELIVTLLLTEQVTVSHCVPTILHMLLSVPTIDTIDLTGWKVVIGGSALPQALCEKALARGIEIYTGYGMSETCPILTLTLFNPKQVKDNRSSHVELRCKAGLPIPLVDLKVVDNNMQERARDGKSEGEIVVRSPWLTQGYHRAEEQSEQLWQGGYLHTGDIGVINKQGYLSITDRLKDVIKTGGEWISSLQLEDIIARHDCVSEVAVIGQPDEKWGERPLAIVVPVKGSSLSEQDVKQVITPFVTSGVLPRWAIPDNVLFVEQIDKTSVGKVDKKQLRKKYAS